MENLSSDGRRGGVQHVLDCASLIVKRMKMGSLGDAECEVPEESRGGEFPAKNGNAL